MNKFVDMEERFEMHYGRWQVLLNRVESLEKRFDDLVEINHAQAEYVDLLLQRVDCSNQKFDNLSDRFKLLLGVNKK